MSRRWPARQDTPSIGSGVRHGLISVDLAVSRTELDQARAELDQAHAELEAAERRAADIRDQVEQLEHAQIEIEARTWNPAIAALRYGQRVRVTETSSVRTRVITGRVDHNRTNERFVYLRSDTPGGRREFLWKRRLRSVEVRVEMLDDAEPAASAHTPVRHSAELT